MSRKKYKKKPFSSQESRLLDFLKANSNRVLNRITIMEHVWEHRGGDHGATLESHMFFLRRKLKKYKLPYDIDTFRGIGYVFKDGDSA